MNPEKLLTLIVLYEIMLAWIWAWLLLARGLWLLAKALLTSPPPEGGGQKAPGFQHAPRILAAGGEK